MWKGFFFVENEIKLELCLPKNFYKFYTKIGSIRVKMKLYWNNRLFCILAEVCDK